MGQYDALVEKRRLLLEAEEWANKTKSIQCHSMSSMWYDDRPQDTADGKSVMDITYNSGLIERRLDSGKVIWFGEKLQGDDLLWYYTHREGTTVAK